MFSGEQRCTSCPFAYHTAAAKAKYFATLGTLVWRLSGMTKFLKQLGIPRLPAVDKNMGHADLGEVA